METFQNNLPDSPRSEGNPNIPRGSSRTLPNRPLLYFAAGFLTASLAAAALFWLAPKDQLPPQEFVQKTEPETSLEAIDLHPAPEEETLFRENAAFDPKRIRAKSIKLTRHVVRNGENYWTIAKKYNITVRTLVGFNPDMPFTAVVGDDLLVPNADGTLHRVEKGENLSSILELYKADEKELKKANGIAWWSPLKTGDTLFIPEARPTQMSTQWKEYYAKRGFFGAPFASWGRGWTSRYGSRVDPITGEKSMHGGMDFKASYGTAVFASASGRVIFAGVNGGYGNLIMIKHSNQYTTYYGHLSKILVRNGESVRKGQQIGKVGSTGRSTGPHLHFEIHKNGKRLDPMPLI